MSVFMTAPEVEPNRLYTADEIAKAKLLPFSRRYILQMWQDGKLAHTKLSPRRIGMFGWQLTEFWAGLDASADETKKRA